MRKIFDLDKFGAFKSRKSLSLRQWALYFLASITLLFVFSAYYTPDMMVAVTNQVWAFCGW